VAFILVARGPPPLTGRVATEPDSSPPPASTRGVGSGCWNLGPLVASTRASRAPDQSTRPSLAARGGARARVARLPRPDICIKTRHTHHHQRTSGSGNASFYRLRVRVATTIDAGWTVLSCASVVIRTSL